MDFKSLVAVLTLVLIAASRASLAQGAEPSVHAPMAHDFGVIEIGREVRHTFSLRNRSPQALEILNVGVSSESLQILSHPDIVAPGGTGQIEVRWIPAEAGELTGFIRLETNGVHSESPWTISLYGRAFGEPHQDGPKMVEPEIPSGWATRILRKVDPRLLVSIESLERQLREGHPLHLVDVRSAADQEKAGIHGAIQSPLFALSSKDFLKAQPVVLVGTGYDYALLETECKRLRGSGFAASILDGGIVAWKARGLPLEGTHVEDISLQILSPADFFRERHMDHWLILNLCGADRELTRYLIPQASMVSCSEELGSLIPQLDELVHDSLENTDAYLLFFDEDGTSYPKIISLLRKSRVKHAFFLQGGIREYRDFVQRQLALSPAGTSTSRGTQAPCPTCPRWE